MVEAALALPVMLGFLFFPPWLHRLYDTKIVEQGATRAEVMYYASHACTGGVPNDIVDQNDKAGASGGLHPGTSEADTTQNAAHAADHVATRLHDSERQGLTREWNTTRTDRTREKKATFGNEHLQLVDHVFTVPANSKVGCNELRFEEPEDGLLAHVRTYARSGTYLYP